MTRCIQILTILLLLAVPVYSGSIDNNPDFLSNGGFINGFVSSSYGNILSDAVVVVYSNEFTVIDTVRTDINGNFNIPVECGEYYVSADAFDYIRRFHPNQYMAYAAELITVFPSQIIHITFELEQGGAISGEIFTGIDQPEDFLVSAVKIDFPYEGWQYDKSFRIASHGEYYLDGLLPGYYKVFIRADGYQTQFYPDAETFKEAEAIQVNFGEVTQGIDFVLEQPGTGIISGYVFDINSNSPLSDQIVLAYTWFDIWNNPYLISTYTDENGYYELEVTAGYHYVEAVIEGVCYLGRVVHLYYDSCFDPKLAELLHVEPLQVHTDINFEFDPTLSYNLTISGSLYDLDNDYPLQDVKISALDYFTGTPIAYSYTLENGDFIINYLITGHYLIELDGNSIIPGFWPYVYNWQEAEIIELVNNGSMLHNGGAITQDYGTPGFSISGIVEEPSGPLDGVRVYAINLQNGSVAFARSNSSGEYNIISGLYDGYYNIFADLYGYHGCYYPYALELDLINNPELEDINFQLNPITVGIEPDMSLPEQTHLLGNFPNPFNSSTNILFSAQAQFKTELEIYNITGQLVKTIPVVPRPGINTVNWNGTTSDNKHAASGVYFYKLRNFPETRRMLLVK